MQNNNNKSKKLKNNKSARTNRRLQVDGLAEMSNYLTKIPKSIMAFPDRYFCQMKYSVFEAVTISAGASSQSVRFRPTSAFDIDPTLGSASIPGYNELAAVYSAYRVTTSKIVVRVSPGGASVPAMTVLLPLNSDPGSGAALAVIQSWLGNPYSKKKVVGTPGSPVILLVNSMSTEKIYGSKMVYMDDNFSALTNATPTNNWYWALGMFSTSPVSGTSVYYVEFDIQIAVEFYDRKELLA
jgi:hypothetical protein